MAGFTLPPPPPGEIKDTNIWRDWIQSLNNKISAVGGLKFVGLDFTGSNLTSILTRNHNDLQNIQGGITTERFHLTSDQYNQATSSSVLLWLSM